MQPLIVAYDDRHHRGQVIALWQTVFGYEAAHNAPPLVIDKKLEMGDGLFFVALDHETVIGTLMAGYDGHRGWIYAVAVAPDRQKKGVGSALLTHAEKALSQRGCMKINLQIMQGNGVVEGFYRANGYQAEQRISMGKQLPENIDGSSFSVGCCYEDEDRCHRSVLRALLEEKGAEVIDD